MGCYSEVLYSSIVPQVSSALAIVRYLSYSARRFVQNTSTIAAGDERSPGRPRLYCTHDRASRVANRGVVKVG